MADIQAEGLRAAGELLERVLDRDRYAPATRATPGERDYAALLDAWTLLLQRYAAALAGPAGGEQTTVPIDSGAPGPPVRVKLTAGRSTIAEVWLENGKPSPEGPLALRCGTLSASDGSELDGGLVDFEPREIERLPGRSSRGVLISLRGEDGVQPGIYRGAIQADGAPALWLPLEVEVAPC